MKRKNKILLLGISGSLSVAALGGVLVSCSKTNNVKKESPTLNIIDESLINQKLEFTSNMLSDSFIKGLQGDLNKENFNKWIKALGSNINYVVNSENQTEIKTIKTFDGEESLIASEISEGTTLTIDNSLEYGTRSFTLTLKKDGKEDKLTFVRNFTERAQPLAKLFSKESKIYFNKENKLESQATLTSSAFNHKLLNANKEKNTTIFSELNSLYKNTKDFKDKKGYSFNYDSSMNSELDSSIFSLEKGNLETDTSIVLNLSNQGFNVLFSINRQDRDDYDNIRNLFTNKFINSNSQSFDFLDIKDEVIQGELKNEVLNVQYNNITNNADLFNQKLFDTTSERKLEKEALKDLISFFNTLASENTSLNTITNPLNENISDTSSLKVKAEKGIKVEESQAVYKITIWGSDYKLEISMTTVADENGLVLQKYLNVNKNSGLNYKYDSEINTFTTNEVITVTNKEALVSYINEYKTNPETSFLSQFKLLDVSLLNSTNLEEQENLFSEMVAPEGYEIKLDLTNLDNQDEVDKARISMLTKPLKVSLVPSIIISEEGEELENNLPTYTMNLLFTDRNMSKLVTALPVDLEKVNSDQIKDVNGVTTIYFDSEINTTINSNSKLNDLVNNSQPKEVVQFILSDILNKNVTTTIDEGLEVSFAPNSLETNSETLTITVSSTSNSETDGKYAFTFVIKSKLSKIINHYKDDIAKEIAMRAAELDKVKKSKKADTTLNQAQWEALETNLNTRVSSVMEKYKDLADALTKHMNSSEATHASIITSLTDSYKIIFKEWSNQFINSNLTSDSQLIKDLIAAATTTEEPATTTEEPATTTEEPATTTEEPATTTEDTTKLVTYVNNIIVEWKKSVSGDLFLVDNRNNETIINADGVPADSYSNAKGRTLDLLKELYTLREWPANASVEFNEAFMEARENFNK